MRAPQSALCLGLPECVGYVVHLRQGNKFAKFRPTSLECVPKPLLVRSDSCLIVSSRLGVAMAYNDTHHMVAAGLDQSVASCAARKWRCACGHRMQWVESTNRLCSLLSVVTLVPFQSVVQQIESMIREREESCTWHACSLMLSCLATDRYLFSQISKAGPQDGFCNTLYVHVAATQRAKF